MIPTHVTEADFLPIDQAMAKYQAEKIEPILDTYRLYDHDELKDFHRRKGKVVHSSRFIQHLLQIEPRLIIQQSVFWENDWGLYFQCRDKLLFVCQISKGWLTEFSWISVDKRDLPDDPHWGWRTVLLRCLNKGILTWEQVIREFGNCQGANADRWWTYTAPFRQSRSSGLIHQNILAHF